MQATNQVQDLDFGRFLPVLLPLSAAGLVLTLVVHTMAWMDVPVPFPPRLIMYGILAVFPPIVLQAQRMAKAGVGGTEGWKLALRGGPAWLEKALRALSYYAALNWLLFVLALMTAPRNEVSDHVWWRGQSSVALVFYGGALAMYIAAAARRKSGLSAPALSGTPAKEEPAFEGQAERGWLGIVLGGIFFAFFATVVLWGLTDVLADEELSLSIKIGTLMICGAVLWGAFAWWQAITYLMPAFLNGTARGEAVQAAVKPWFRQFFSAIGLAMLGGLAVAALEFTK